MGFSNRWLEMFWLVGRVEWMQATAGIVHILEHRLVPVLQGCSRVRIC